MISAIVVGLGITASAILGRAALRTFTRPTSHPSFLTAKQARLYSRGGFASEMTRKEAAQILGVREGVTIDKIKQAHRRVMLANHPGNDDMMLISCIRPGWISVLVNEDQRSKGYAGRKKVTVIFSLHVFCIQFRQSLHSHDPFLLILTIPFLLDTFSPEHSCSDILCLSPLSGFKCSNQRY